MDLMICVMIKMIIITCWSVSLVWWSSSLGTTAARRENISAGTCSLCNYSEIFCIFWNIWKDVQFKGTSIQPVRGPSRWGWALETFHLLCSFQRETPAARWRARLCRGATLSGGRLLSPEIGLGLGGQVVRVIVYITGVFHFVTSNSKVALTEWTTPW